jgi:3-oxoacyl-[acyl-carrier protein] reductase
MRLKNKVAIVTGSGQGIGREIALTLAKEGAKVVISDITDMVYDVVKEIEKIGSQALAIKTDVSKRKETEEMAKKTLQKFGRIDILVNNAGIFPFKSLLEMEEEDWDRVLSINLKGVFNSSKAVLPIMVKQKYGKIINIASVAGTRVGFLNLAHYSASKGGILGFTKTAALELAQYGINVNTIAPGAIDTPGARTGMGGKESLEQFAKTIPAKRIGKPIDIANLVVFLASDESSYITGECIVIDGGFTIQ